MNLLKNWHLMRILRFSLGVLMVGESVRSQQWFLLGFGVFFTYVALANKGCGVACETKPSATGNEKEIKYEEVR